MTDPTDTDIPNTSVDDELIVHLPHLRLVTTALGILGIQVTGTPEQHRPLDLARLKLAGSADVTNVLAQLRAHFAAQYGQWMPLMDSNQHVATVIGMPQPKSMSISDDPEQTDPPAPVPFTPAGRGIRVGVLDTKIDAHPDLIGRFVAEPSARYRPLPEPVPLRAGHATFVASLITRMAPAVTIDAHAVLNRNGRATAWHTATAMMTFADSGIDILNLSLGCRTNDGLAPLLMSRAVTLLNQRMLIVAAAGNHGAADDLNLRVAPTWPAALPDVVAVGARGLDGKRAPFSPNLPWVTCTAPGEKVTGGYLKALIATTKSGPQQFDGYATWSGTSFATATVSGAIAAATHRRDVRAALARLLAESNGVVRQFTQCDDDQRA
ncbi:MAG TPA: S8 family serine peptidase [Pseudonocardiaceae bacterium]|jgi:subtilisin family serine protease|nr:S8 family serine peptidase [Pseudonocardiaceae bacterium]